MGKIKLSWNAQRKTSRNLTAKSGDLEAPMDSEVELQNVECSLLEHTQEMSVEPKVIALENISKRFGKTVAVYDYSISATAGNIISLLGPNGSGKSTLIRIMTGLMSPCSGKGHCMGYDLYQDNLLIRSRIGYMPQKFSLYRQLTVHENLQLFANIHRVENPERRVHDIIQEFGLTKYQHQYACQLSGGWQQRLSLAVSIVHRPALLILDEPTAGVDPDSRQIIWKQIQTLSKQGITILVATHYMDEAVKSHAIQFLFYGKIVTSGSRQDIVRHSGLTTWEVSGENARSVLVALNHAMPSLQQLEYGDHLRISSTDPAIYPSIQTISEEHGCLVRTVQPALEDCFVYYSSCCKDERL